MDSIVKERSGKMNRETLTEQILQYVPFNEQEEKDKALILSMLAQYGSLFERSCGIAHMTASAWTVNESFTKAVMCYHNIYNSWSWLGGHADGNEDLPAVALKEVREESGIDSLRLYSEDIFSLESLTVDGHVKKGIYVPSHIHLNITYLVIADEAAPLSACEGENSGVRWFSLEDAVNASTEPWFQEHVYRKLNAKLSLLRNG